MKIYAMYCKYNNNDIHAGTQEQEDALRNAVADGIIPSLHMKYHELHKEYLQSINLYDITLSDGTSYKYGHGWSYKPIPDDDILTIQTLIEKGY